MYESSSVQLKSILTKDQSINVVFTILEQRRYPSSSDWKQDHFLHCYFSPCSACSVQLPRPAPFPFCSQRMPPPPRSNAHTAPHPELSNSTIQTHPLHTWRAIGRSHCLNVCVMRWSTDCASFWESESLEMRDVCANHNVQIFLTCRLFPAAYKKKSGGPRPIEHMLTHLNSNAAYQW